MPFRRVAPCLFVLTLWSLFGCQVAPPGPGPEAPPRLVDVPPPPNLPGSFVAPRQGEDLRRARLSLAQIVASVERPACLPPLAVTTRPAGPPTRPAHEPPSLEAQRAYFAARVAWDESQTQETIRQLDIARNLAPQSPEVLRFLSEVYDHTGNRLKAVAYLRDAVALDPGDTDSLLILARWEFEEGNWSAVVSLLDQGLKSIDPRTEPAEKLLIHYYLGRALDIDHYDAAAVDQYVRLLQSPEAVGRTNLFALEARVLEREHPAIWVLVGDARNRLGRPAEALDAYQHTAALEGADERRDLAQRLTYTYLRLGRPGDAQKTVLAYLEAERGTETDLGLVSYLAANGVEPAGLAQGLQALYVGSDRPASLAILIGDLLDPVAARRFLRQHVHDRPTDWTVFDALLRRDLGARPGADRAESLRSAAGAIADTPRAADRYADSLLDWAGNARMLLPAFDKLSVTERRQPEMRYLQALLLAESRRTGEAVAQLETVMANPAAPDAARLLLARLLLQRGQADRAEAVLQPLAHSEILDAVLLRARVLARLNRTAEALALLDDALTHRPQNVELILSKAMLQLAGGGADGAAVAEATLTNALNASPKSERLYEALFSLYQGQPARDGANKRIQLFRRLVQTMPQARLTRWLLAKENLDLKQYAQAELFFRGMTTDNPRDFAALSGLLSTLYLSGKADQAQSLLKERLAAETPGRELLQVARSYYVSAAQDLLQKDQAQAAADLLREALEGPNEDPSPFLRVLAAAWIRLGKQDAIDPAFQEKIQQFPELRSDLTFEWAMAWERAGQSERSENLLAEVLRLEPGHARAANALGYQWADRGLNLPKAKELIQTALQDEPDSSAYLDSMGWVHYKQGDFKAAVDYLRQAAAQDGGDDPVILSHLGDALCRGGQVEEAGRVWKIALQAVPDARKLAGNDDKELRTVAEGLQARVDAVDKGQSAATADSPGAAGSVPTSHPAPPTSAPSGR